MAIYHKILVPPTYLGQFQQGDVVPLRMLSATAPPSPTPAWPAERGTFRIYKPDGTRIYNWSPNVVDHYRTGFIGVNLRLGSAYTTTGLYTAYMALEVNTTAKGPVTVAVWTFRIVAGGNPDGHVHSLAYWNRPEAQYIVGANEEGEVFQGQNPEV